MPDANKALPAALQVSVIRGCIELLVTHGCIDADRRSGKAETEA